MSGKNNVANASEEVATVPEVTPEQMAMALKVLSSLTTTAKTPKDPKKAEEERKKAIMKSEVDVSPETFKILIPKGMTKLEASEELYRQYKDEENKSDFNKQFTGPFTDDIMVAIKKTAEEVFGWIQGKTIYSFFGNTPPTYIHVVTGIKNGIKTTEECFYGKFEISAWEHASAIVTPTGFNSVKINISAKKKFSKQIADFFTKIEVHLKTKSIYKGKTISLEVNEEQGGNIVANLLEVKTNDRIFLNEKTDLLIDKFITPDLAEKGKRTCLFTGSFGNGKTETAMRLGKMASEQFGYTFIYVKTSTHTKKALMLAKVYEPAILFVEDIDQVISGNERDEEINSILNTIDGIEYKGARIKTFFTTNSPEKLNPALRRPGRIDMLVKFENPNAPTKKNILASWVVDLPGYDTLDWDHIVREVKDVQAAIVAEMGERARKLAIKNKSVTTEDVLAAIFSLETQIEYMMGDVKEDRSLEKALATMGAALNGKLNEHIAAISSAVGAS